ncbi:MAG: response regulator [Clostridia bacterium]|nr:response regulator [Clostridia bacterium]
MYKVMIVDDEDYIVQGLVNYIPWEQYGCHVVAVARDGNTGLELIKEKKPDILFTDIRMPNATGLTMIENIRELFPDLQITVITGYRDFEYAQHAIKLGVVRFVLKPTKMDELTEALNTMIANLNKIKAEEPSPASDSDDKTDKTETGEELLEDDKGDNSGSFIAKNALKYIEENFAKHLTLSMVADSIYVSQWHLSRVLKKYQDLSFTDLLNTVRIKKAKEMMSDPSLKIHDISKLVGFSDVSHFSKIFKKFEGVSPNEYRNQHIK